MSERTGLDTIAGRAVWLRRDAERISGSLAPLLAEAERLAATIVSGVHGRRRAGPGEEFWQYRRALPGDVATSIDWRRSARSDLAYIREMEWDSAQTVTLWCDTSKAMQYASHPDLRRKADRAKLLTLALAVLLSGAGERLSLLKTAAERPRSGEVQLRTMAMALSGGDADAATEYARVPAWPEKRSGRAVFLSDFLGPTDTLRATLDAAVERGVKGTLLQINDPAEEAFPFDGRVRFLSVGASLSYETDRAGSIRSAYVEKLAERRALLQDLALSAGWQFSTHRTSESPRKALLWLYTLIGGIS